MLRKNVGSGFFEGEASYAAGPVLPSLAEILADLIMGEKVTSGVMAHLPESGRWQHLSGTGGIKFGAS